MPTSYTWPLPPATFPSVATRTGKGGGLASLPGQDVSTFPGLDVTFSLMTPRRSIAEGAARRLVTPQGALWRHPTYGRDLRRHLSAPMTTQKLQLIKHESEGQIEQDERIQSSTVKVSFADDTKTLRVQATLIDADGPFTFSAAINQIGITQFQVQE